MVRHENWPLLLSNYIVETKNNEFIWGQHDCLQFVAKAVERLTGVDFYTKYCTYDTEDGCNELLEREGGVEAIINKCLGEGSRNTLKAGRGDVVTVKLPHVMAGIVDDTGKYILVVTQEGVKKLPVRLAWKIWSY